MVLVLNFEEGLTYRAQTAIFLTFTNSFLGWTKAQTASTPPGTGTHNSVTRNLSSLQIRAHPPPGCLLVFFLGLLYEIT